MLASDMNNPEFQGARNPDSGLYVEFYMFEAIDKWASEEKSREQQRKVVVKLPQTPFIRIMVPGDKTSEFTTAVTEAHKQRFPREWMAWQISEGLIGGEEDIPGWKLTEWTELPEDLVRELQYLRFQTVEQLAGASDKQIQGIGIGGVSLREQARVALRNKMGAETRDAIEKQEKENQELKDEMAAMKKQMAELLASQKPEGSSTKLHLPKDKNANQSATS
jgi:hypothetical protein